MILLSAISGENLYRYNIDIYYEYLDYIRSLGLPKEVLQSFYNIYIPKHNINPREFLEDIDADLEEELSFKVFQKRL